MAYKHIVVFEDAGIGCLNCGGMTGPGPAPIPAIFAFHRAHRDCKADPNRPPEILATVVGLAGKRGAA